MRVTALLLAIAARSPWAHGAARTGASAQATLDNVKQQGLRPVRRERLGPAGLRRARRQGNWSGLDVDLCRAIAAAIFGDPTKVKFTPLNAKDRFTALQSGEIDVLSRNTTWTMSRDTALGLDFTGVNYYDGQGFMVRRRRWRRQRQGARRRLGLRPGRHHHRAQPRRLLPRQQHEVQAGRVREQRRGQQGLRGRPLRRAHHRRSRASTPTRVKLANADDHVVLPEIISKEPLGPGRAPGRRPVGRHRPLDPVRDAQRRGVRRHQAKRRADEGRDQDPGDQALARRSRRRARSSA